MNEGNSWEFANWPVDSIQTDQNPDHKMTPRFERSTVPRALSKAKRVLQRLLRTGWGGCKKWHRPWSIWFVLLISTLVTVLLLLVNGTYLWRHWPIWMSSYLDQRWIGVSFNQYSLKCRLRLLTLAFSVKTQTVYLLSLKYLHILRVATCIQLSATVLLLVTRHAICRSRPG